MVELTTPTVFGLQLLSHAAHTFSSPKFSICACAITTIFAANEYTRKQCSVHTITAASFVTLRASDP